MLSDLDRPFDSAAGLLLRLLGQLPAPAEALIGRLLSQQSFVNTVCTNVPGPPGPRTLLGRRVLEIHPVVPLFQAMGLEFAILSYGGRLSITAAADPGLIPDADTTATYAETGADSSALVAGKAAMGLLWSNQIAAYQAAMTDVLGATTLPKGGEKSYVIQMSQYMGINKASENKEAAALFINFFVTSPDAGAVLQTNRGVPSSPVVRQAIAGKATETDAAVYRIYDAVADRTIPQDPNLPNDQEFVSELMLIGQQVAFGQSTVDEAAADLQALIERLAVK